MRRNLTSKNTKENKVLHERGAADFNLSDIRFSQLEHALRLDIKRKLVQRSEKSRRRVASTEPWILANLYSGNIYIWNHQTNTSKSFEVTELPVRTPMVAASSG